MDEHNWDGRVGHLEREGMDLLGVVTAAALLAAELTGPVRRIVDVGSGPGVGTSELARCFPDAQVVAVDASRPMLERAVERATSLGVGDRVSTYQATLPDGLDNVGPADIVFASMSLHHMPNPDEAMGAIGRLLTGDGLVVVIEHGSDGAHGDGPNIDTPALLRSAGFHVLAEQSSFGRLILVARPAPQAR